MCMQEMAEAGTTAQVHPQKLTMAFMEAAQANGAKLVRGTVQGITIDKDSNSVTGESMPSVSATCAALPGLCLWPLSVSASTTMHRGNVLGLQTFSTVMLSCGAAWVCRCERGWRSHPCRQGGHSNGPMEWRCDQVAAKCAYHFGAKSAQHPCQTHRRDWRRVPLHPVPEQLR